MASFWNHALAVLVISMGIIMTTIGSVMSMSAVMGMTSAKDLRLLVMTLVSTGSKIKVFNVAAKLFLVVLWHFVRVVTCRVANLVAVIQVLESAVFVDPLALVAIKPSWFVMPILSVKTVRNDTMFVMRVIVIVVRVARIVSAAHVSSSVRTIVGVALVLFVVVGFHPWVGSAVLLSLFFAFPTDSIFSFRSESLHFVFPMAFLAPDFHSDFPRRACWGPAMVLCDIAENCRMMAALILFHNIRALFCAAWTFSWVLCRPLLDHLLDPIGVDIRIGMWVKVLLLSISGIMITTGPFAVVRFGFGRFVCSIYSIAVGVDRARRDVPEFPRGRAAGPPLLWSCSGSVLLPSAL